MTQTKLTKEIQEYIIKYSHMSNRALREAIGLNFGLWTSHVAVGNFKKKHLTTIPKTEMKALVRKGKRESEILGSLEKTKVQDRPRKKVISIPGYDDFIVKIEKSSGASAKELKELLKVSGKHKKDNRTRVIRIIQYTLNALQEE